MKKIYSHPKSEIERIMKELLKYGLKTHETEWKIIDVQDELVIFRIHQEIRLLMLKHIAKISFPHAKLSFSSRENDFWDVTVENNGAESYFFRRVLLSILKDFEGINMTPKQQNLEIIERAMEAAIRKTGRNPSDFPINIIEKKKGETEASIFIPGAFKCTMPTDNVDIMAKKIGRDIPQLIRQYSS